jgi:HK97 family phage portal protein
MQTNFLTKAKNFFVGVRKKTSKYITDTIYIWQSGIDVFFDKYNPDKGQAMIEGNELAFACVTFISRSASEPTMTVVDEEGEQIKEHPARQLFFQPNALQSEFDFWEFVILQLMLAGNSFVQKIRNNSGQVVQLWPVTKPQQMQVIIDDDGQIIAWQYQSLRGAIQIPPSEIIHFKLPRYDDLYFGYAPMAVAVRSVERNNKSMDFIDTFFDNAAVPQGLLKTKKQLETYEAERYAKLFKAKYSGSGRFDIAVLDNETEYQKMGMGPGELEMPSLNALDESKICQIFGIPPVLIHAMIGLENSTYNNISTLRELVWDLNLSPLFTRLQDKLNSELAVDFGLMPSNMPFQWDFSKVLALQARMLIKKEQALAEFQAGVITRNEYRSVAGYEADTQGDIYLVNQSLIAMPQNEQFVLPEPEPEQTQDVGEGTVADEQEEDVVEQAKMIAKMAWPIESELYFREVKRAKNGHKNGNGTNTYKLV